jgi:hypothetical protein
MKVLNVAFLTRAIIYFGVRIGGWFAWWENNRLKARGVKRMRPADETWPTSPNWYRIRIWPGEWFTKKTNRVSAFSRKASAA